MANCPGKNTLAVAELAIGLMIAADRRIVNASMALRSGSWKKKEFGKARGLAGRTLGILGFGAVGRAVGQRATALGMKLVTWSPLDLTAEQAAELGIGYMNSVEEVAAVANVVTIHLRPDARNETSGRQEVLRRHEARRDSDQHVARAAGGYGSHAGGNRREEDPRRHGRV